MTATETETPLTRAETAALLGPGGIIAAAIGYYAGITPLLWAGIGVGLVGALLGMSAGWFVGLTPRPAAAAASLVGMRIRFGDSVFTVLDDSAPSVAAAMRGGGRCSVVATDAGGGVGLLFLALDGAGRVTAAATEERDWAAAGEVGV